MNSELKQIKNIYGEEMMHLCRDLFPSLLETQGLLLSILQKHLAPSRTFANDIKEKNLYEEFKSWIYSFIDVEEKNQVINTKTPFELMDEAGYILTECKTEDDIQSFRKYYASNEVLCTIYNGGRLNRCHVFFAVKKNATEIKRESFSNPQREDEYGTSVISIQFARDKHHTLSIKNRYNHTVNNPDATFSNNLENIIHGLTSSFEGYLGFKINQNENKQEDFLTYTLPYVKAQDGKYYRYNIEADGIYYCENNIIIQDGLVIAEYAKNPERYILLDEYIFDLKEKKIILYNGDSKNNSFIRSIEDVGKISKVEVLKNKENKEKTITICYGDNKHVKIVINGTNAIIGYENDYVDKIGDWFLCNNNQLSSVSLPQVQAIGTDFLNRNQQLSSISLPQVQTIGDYFLLNNEQLSSISLPQVRTIGNDFLFCNERLNNILLPQVQTIGNDFLCYNQQLSSISLPQVRTIGDSFLYDNQQLSSISLPQVKTIGDSFLRNYRQLSSISLPQVKIIGDSFLFNNAQLNSISLPRVQRIGSCFLPNNQELSSITLPQVQIIGDHFLHRNMQLSSISLPQVQTIGNGFLFYNQQLSSISLPQVQRIGARFLDENNLIDKEEIIRQMEERDEEIKNSRNR